MVRTLLGACGESKTDLMRPLEPILRHASFRTSRYSGIVTQDVQRAAGVQPPPTECLNAAEVCHIKLPPLDGGCVSLRLGESPAHLNGGGGMHLPLGYVLTAS